MKRLLPMAVALGLTIGASACSVTPVPGSFPCNSDGQCNKNGVAGFCIEGYCALPDPNCTSGKKWDQTAGNGMANMCVPVSLPDMPPVPDLGGIDGGPQADMSGDAHVCVIGTDHYNNGCGLK